MCARVQRPECWLKKALAVKSTSLSLEAAPAATAAPACRFPPPLLRVPDIEARLTATSSVVANNFQQEAMYQPCVCSFSTVLLSLGVQPYM